MSTMMNRKDWLKSSGTLVAGGISMLSTGMISRNRSVEQIKKDLRSSRKFVSDRDFMRTFPEDFGAIRLMANENPWGPSPKAKEAIIKATEQGNRYPILIYESFLKRIAEYEKVEVEQLMLTPGSSGVLTGAGIYFTSLGGNIVTADPSYSDMPDFAESLGAEVRWVPLNDEFKLDLKAMEDKVDGNTKVVYICNPNNPTGTKLDTRELKEFCKRVSKKTHIFVDEAYLDYQDDPLAESMMPLVREGYNITVAKTFSKLYGFAGMRIGYAVSSPEMIKNLDNNARGFYGISMLALEGANAAFQETEFLDHAKKQTIASREYLYSVLEKEGYEYIPSHTNFVMFPIRMSGDRFVQEIWKRGVAVRNWEFNNQQWCRVSIGKMESMEAFATAFKQIS